MPETATAAPGENITATQTQEAAQATGASASQQETTGSAEKTATSTAPNGQKPAESAKPAQEAEWEWNGNVDDVEAPFKKRALGIQRYLTKRSQELASSQKKAQEYDRIMSDPNVQAYMERLKGANGQAQASPQHDAPPMLDWEQLGVDPNVGSAIDRLIQSRIQTARDEAMQYLNRVDQKQSHLERMQEIQDFGDVHPDMWDMYHAGIFGPILREVVDVKKGTLEDAYNIAKGIRDRFRNDAIQKSQERVQQKKAAFSSTPSPAGEVDTMWVDPQDSFRIAFENALQQKRVNVRTRR